MDKTKKKARTEEERALYPGTCITLHDGKLRVEVYPLGVRQISAFTRLLEEIAPRLKAGGMSVEQALRDWKTAMVSIAPMIAEPLCDMLDQCCVIEQPANIEFSSLAHYDLAAVAEAWLVESFGAEGKARPWITLVETTLRSVTGEEVPIWATLSKHLSRADTPGTTSSIDGSPAALTQDGAPHSSGTGSSGQAESS